MHIYLDMYKHKYTSIHIHIHTLTHTGAGKCWAQLYSRSASPRAYLSTLAETLAVIHEDRSYAYKKNFLPSAHLPLEQLTLRTPWVSSLVILSMNLAGSFYVSETIPVP